MAWFDKMCMVNLFCTISVYNVNPYHNFKGFVLSSKKS